MSLLRIAVESAAPFDASRESVPMQHLRGRPITPRVIARVKRAEKEPER
jgi:hypothetical protein